MNFETRQDVDNYHETSHSSGFSIDMTKGLRPDFGISASRGNMDSDYASTTKQAGIYAGKEGFNICTEDNTHLKGAVIASEAEADKNKISTGSLSWEDIENKAEYDAKSIGFDYHKYGDFAQKSKQSQDELYKTKGLTSNLGMPAHGDDKNTTHAAIASGNIEIRNGQQDIRGLSRDTQNALSTLGKIFDKSTIEEQQELAKVFGEEAYRLAHNMKDDGSARKIAVHAAIGGIMSQITGSGFTSGAIGAGVNEAVIKEISKIKDPGTAQIVSGIVGAAVAKVAGGNAGAGAVAAASGTRNNHLGEGHSGKPKEVGIGVETVFTGHISLIIVNDDGTMEEGNYGRYGNEASSQGIQEPIGPGKYVIDNNYNLHQDIYEDAANFHKQIFILDNLIVNVNDVEYLYNSQIDYGGYKREDKDISLQNGRKSGYYYDKGNGENDYNIITNNCITTTINPIKNCRNS